MLFLAFPGMGRKFWMHLFLVQSVGHSRWGVERGTTLRREDNYRGIVRTDVMRPILFETPQFDNAASNLTKTRGSVGQPGPNGVTRQALGFRALQVHKERSWRFRAARAQWKSA